MKVWSGEAGQIALGKVDDDSGRRARGVDGAAGRVEDGARRRRRVRRQDDQRRRGLARLLRASSSLGLADLRRPLSLRNLDLLALLSFSISLCFFNEGEVFWSVPLAYPPLVYLLGRLRLDRRRDRPPRAVAARSGPSGCSRRRRSSWPASASGSTSRRSERDRRRLRGRHRRAPDRERRGAVRALAGRRSDLKPCGPADAEGEIRERIQTNGRCESSNARGDTYGPVSYLAYVPGYAVFGWTGKWDELCRRRTPPRSLFDLLCLARARARRPPLRRRRGSRRRSPSPGPRIRSRTTCSNSNTNDAIMPAFLIWGFWLASSAWARGAAVALAGWTKFAALLLAPLWLTYPDGRGSPARRFAVGVRGRDARGVLGPAARAGPASTRRASSASARSASSSTASRRSRSGTGASTTPPGIPDLHLVQLVLQVLLVAGAVARRVRAAPEVAAPARRADRRAADRLRARPDPLVLPLHPVVLPLRRRSRCSCRP